MEERGRAVSLRGFRDLIAWQKGMDFAVACYRASWDFPRDERFNLRSQLQRSSSSVPFNIAEGYGLGTDPLFLKHLRIARGSLCETLSALELCRRLGYSVNESLDADADEIARILHGLIRSVEQRINGPSDHGDHH